MANIRKIEGKSGTAYKITVTQGRDSSGKQIRHYKTWTPDHPMTARQMEKEVQRVALAFEQEIENGIKADDRQTFLEYANYVLDLKERNGAEKATISIYKFCLGKCAPYIGHLRLRNIRPQHLNRCYEALSQPGQGTHTIRYTPTIDFKSLLKEMGLTTYAFGQKAGVTKSAILKLYNGKGVKQETAEKVAAYLEKPVTKIFEVTGLDGKLSAATLHRIHLFISAVFGQAEKEMLININPARRATPPKDGKHEPNYYQPETLAQILAAVDTEPIMWRAMIYLFAVSGCRNGEVIGLKWSKVNFEKNEITIDSALKMDKLTHTLYDGCTKTKQRRSIIIPVEVMQLLKKQKISQIETRLKCGDRWIESDYVFTETFGGPLYPTMVNTWLNGFAKRHGLPHLNPHGFRHSAASLLIANDVDIVSVSALLGHSRVSMTTDTYSHIIEDSKRRTAECISDVLLKKHG